MRTLLDFINAPVRGIGFLFHTFLYRPFFTGMFDAAKYYAKLISGKDNG